MTASSKSTDDVIDATPRGRKTCRCRKGWEKWTEGITREQLEKEGPRPAESGRRTIFCPLAKGGFATASGKAELYSASLAGAGYGSVVHLFPLKNHACQKGQRNFRWELLSRKADNFLNSSFTQQFHPSGRWSSGVAGNQHR